MSATTTAKTTATWMLYVFVVLEFLFMITPFLAFSWYPTYGALLGNLNESRWTSGLNSFFLPHFSATYDPAINALPAIGRAIAAIGLLLFLIGAAQVYSAKLLRRPAVTGGLYRFARHPQYAALILLGFGLLLWWPRFLVLFAFVTMVFLYVALARHEENRCLAQFGDSYANYRDRVGMFGPSALSITRWVPAHVRKIPQVAAYVISLALAGIIAFALREHSLGHLAAVYRPSEVIVSPALLDRSTLEGASATALADPRVQAALKAAGDQKRIIYVVPDAYYLPDLPIDPPGAVTRAGHGAPKSFDATKLQVLIARARTHSHRSTGEGILRSAHGLDPVIVANLDMAAGRVIAVTKPPAHVVWGDIPMPLF